MPPIIPKFTLSQDDDFVYVNIYLPHIRVSSSELEADGYDFTFYCQPYLLKLTLPNEVDGTSDKCRGVFDPITSDGILVAHLPKKIKGQVFENLDLTTKLLQLRSEKDNYRFPKIPQSIEVVSSSTISDGIDYGEEECDEGIVSYDNECLLGLKLDVSYGFNNKYSKVLGTLVRDNFVDMLENRSPDVTVASDRRRLRLEHENKLFDPYRYLGDLYGVADDPIYTEATSYLLPYATAAVDEFAVKEQEMLIALPNKEYLIVPASKDEEQIFLCCMDLLYAYLYDSRITQGERNPESCFNVTRMSSVLSWLDSYDRTDDDVATVIKSNLRRSLIYPYIRHLHLSYLVADDVIAVLKRGKRCMLKCMLSLKSILEHSDSHYILNKLYIDDYCIWLQTVSDDIIVTHAVKYQAAFNMIKMKMNEGEDMLGFRLTDIEEWADKKLDYDDDDDDDDSSDDDDDDNNDDDKIPDHLCQYTLPADLLNCTAIGTSTALSSTDVLSTMMSKVAIVDSNTVAPKSGNRIQLLREINDVDVAVVVKGEDISSEDLTALD